MDDTFLVVSPLLNCGLHIFNETSSVYLLKDFIFESLINLGCVNSVDFVVHHVLKVSLPWLHIDALVLDVDDDPLR